MCLTKAQKSKVAEILVDPSTLKEIYFLLALVTTSVAFDSVQVHCRFVGKGVATLESKRLKKSWINFF
jgi:hypothetical protein